MTAEPADVAARGKHVQSAIVKLSCLLGADTETLTSEWYEQLGKFADAILASQRALAAELRGEWTATLDKNCEAIYARTNSVLRRVEALEAVREAFRRGRHALPAVTDEVVEFDGKRMEFECCASCGHDLDTGWECNTCGRNWRAWAMTDPTKSVDGGTVARGESWRMRARHAETKLRQAVDKIHALEAAGEAQGAAHRACLAAEHDPERGKMHGCCVICGTPFPCEFVQPAPAPARDAERTERARVVQHLIDKVDAAEAEVARLTALAEEHADTMDRLAAAQELLRRWREWYWSEDSDGTAKLRDDTDAHLAAHAGGPTFDDFMRGSDTGEKTATEVCSTQPRPASAGARYVAAVGEWEAWVHDCGEDRTLSKCNYFGVPERNKADADRIAAALNADAGAMAVVREALERWDALPLVHDAWSDIERRRSEFDWIRKTVAAMRVLAASAAREGGGA